MSCVRIMIRLRMTLFLFQEAHDAVLERLREEKLSVVALVIQRVMRGYRDRCSTLTEKGK